MNYLSRRQGVSKLGVNVFGYFTSELGMGELGRLLLDGVKASGLPYASITNNDNESRKHHSHEEVNSDKYYPINLAVLNADQIEHWKRSIRETDFNDLPTIGIWAWELEDFPDHFDEVFEVVEEIWTISEFCKKAIEKQTTKPVFVIPLPKKLVQQNEIKHPQLHGLDLASKPYFLALFDYQSSIDRKNPLAAIKAFKEAFNDAQDVQLVIKTINGNLWPSQRQKLLVEIKDRTNIQIVDQYLGKNEVLGLIKGALGYVSLHRSEGYGLTCAEAMALGTPVIATGYSGNLDFMNKSNSLLVDYTLIPVEDSSGAYKIRSRWAEPKIDSAARFMNQLYYDGNFAIGIGKAGQDSIRKSREHRRTAKFIRDRVRRVNTARRRLQAKQNRVPLIRRIAPYVPKSVKRTIRRIISSVD